MFVDLKDFDYMKSKYRKDILNDNNNREWSYEINDSNKNKTKLTTIKFYDDHRKLRLIRINENYEIFEKDEFTDEEKEMLNKKEKYLNEHYLDDNDQIDLSEKDMNDYLNNTIFCGFEINDNIKKRDTNLDSGILNRNANENDLSEGKLKVAKEITKKSFEICNNFEEDKECTGSIIIEKYCINKFNSNHLIDNKSCKKYSTTEIEPKDISIILNHIKQIAPIVNKYKDLIFIHQGAFIGTWGEMHSSAYTDSESLAKIINYIDTYFDSSIYLSVRKPYDHRRINEMLQTMKERNYKSIERLGLFNDGLFYDEKDYGTYGKSNVPITTNNGLVQARRLDEEEFQNKLCLNVPNGGEGIYLDGKDPNKNLQKSQIPKLLENPDYYPNFYVSEDHARKIHLTYLNRKYDTSLHDLWKQTDGNHIYDPNWNVNGLEYISNHLGYRYVLRESTFINNTLKVYIQNVGYAPAYYKFKIVMFLRSSKNYFRIDFDNDNRTWSPGDHLHELSIKLKNYKFTKNIPYHVYINMHDERSNNTIMFGNSNPYVNNSGYKIGTIIVN
ncbi:hypothetical protein BCR36DRAFT_445731 [Piromyces finnis]|uniref:DUF4832 domain-containing protein n=1 Tax=Piromyces finnis TaxID=1754191 RepID=A0A1Y1VCE5_9FUNG|nr:hypothetical protein BCR36DRAFT_445731 [Piromyces finnis]|eukprot:ORX51778.1 hypothetical protein BCR36DRAFT_445731 [Piromyces finnis]